MQTLVLIKISTNSCGQNSGQDLFAGHNCFLLQSSLKNHPVGAVDDNNDDDDNEGDDNDNDDNDGDDEYQKDSASPVALIRFSKLKKSAKGSEAMRGQRTQEKMMMMLMLVLMMTIMIITIKMVNMWPSNLRN